MQRATLTVGIVCICLMGWASTLDGREPLTLQVSPTVALAPGFANVHATIEASDDNRLLEIVVQSADFYRSSDIQLDGRTAPRVAAFAYADLPAGQYQVKGILTGTHGTRAEVTRIVLVLSR
jgi:hypothetical protein